MNQNKKTTVVNLYKDIYDEYIGRGSIYGNPYTHLDKSKTKAEIQVPTRKDSIDCFKKYFYERINNDPYFKKKILELKGKKSVVTANRNHATVILLLSI